jgi:hypothetical protein
MYKMIISSKTEYGYNLSALQDLISLENRDMI